ncbi:tRNA lysidine(34) synthetase TilS [Hippea jasoniae]|uniref:tRNA lysidine(34) synthetase TilS n=1 Tax=Hippea jasoniae TaxID=944479 RepID=UPI000691BFC3|nr:tRNA lysidine(34) synthetase TilS [Hippea jasoniae]
MKKAFLKRLNQFIDKFKLISCCERIGVAVSGGPDSVFLLNLLNAIKENYKIELAVLHFNHRLRKEAYAEANFVEDLANSLNIEFLAGSFDVGEFARLNKLSTEEAARKKRYEFFKEAKKKLKLDRIATGHTKDDLVETFFMNLLRGATIEGLTSLKPRYSIFIRPILTFSKNEIVEYLKQNNIKFVIDSSNFDTKYTRNRIRHELIEQLKTFNPNLVDTIFNNYLVMLSQAKIIDELTTINIAKHVRFYSDYCLIDVKNIKNPALIGSIIKEAIKKLLNNHYSLSSININRIVDEVVFRHKTVHLRKLLTASTKDGVVKIKKL